MEDLYYENYKTLLKEIKEDINNGKTAWASFNGQEDLTLLKWQYHPKRSTGSTQSLSNSNSLFHKSGKADPQIHMELQGTQNSQNNLKKKNKVSGLTVSQLQNLLQSYSK